MDGHNGIAEKFIDFSFLVKSKFSLWADGNRPSIHYVAIMAIISRVWCNRHCDQHTHTCRLWFASQIRDTRFAALTRRHICTRNYSTNSSENSIFAEQNCHLICDDGIRRRAHLECVASLTNAYAYETTTMRRTRQRAERERDLHNRIVMSFIVCTIRK